MASVLDQPRIAGFMAADHAEAINGKLYVMGGGFDTVAPAAYPADVRFAFAAILLVPWNDTNRRFPIAGSAETVDGDDLGWIMQGELEAGRPAGRRGGEITVVLAGPVAFHAEEPVNFVLKLKFANDERAVPVSLAPPAFPHGAGPVPPE